MKICNMMKESIKRIDLLGTPASLRSSGEPSYETVLGGSISGILILIFGVIFVFKLLSIVNHEAITFDENFFNVQNQTFVIQDFYFGIKIDQMTDKQMKKWFKFQLQVIEDTVNSTVNVNLIDCPPNWWMKKNITNSYLYQDNYLCPEEPDKLKIYSTSSSKSFMRLTVKYVNRTDPQFLAFEERFLTQNEAFTLDIRVADTLISPRQKEPIQWFANKMPLTQFGNNVGVRSKIILTHFQVSTDSSFMPFSSLQNIQGYFIQNYQSTIPIIYKNQVAICTIQKSQILRQVYRQFGKFDELLSYVGGLFGLLFVSVVFFLSPYSQYKYELMVGQNVFKNQSLDKIQSITQKNWTFFTYIQYAIYDWLQFFHCSPKKWKKIKQLNQSRNQGLFMLDAKFLFKRIQYLQTALELLVSQNKRTCLKLIDLPAIQKIRIQRKKMELFQNYRLNKNQERKDNNSQTQMASQNIYEFIKPTRVTFQQRKDLVDKMEDSEELEDQDLKITILNALKQMITNRWIDEQYYQIYSRMDKQFKNWVQRQENANNLFGYERQQDNLMKSPDEITSQRNLRQRRIK